MRYKVLFVSVLMLFISIMSMSVFAQNSETKTEEKVVKEKTGLTLGGYGEATFTRNFYSDNFNRYSSADLYKNQGYHNRVDLPHVTFFVGYEFGNGWRMNSEIEFEHGGNETAMEIEAEESGEYEKEIERGGEVALEQFWLEKTFNKTFNLRLGHMIVPVGYTNGHHLPTEFFTVFRPMGENTILPCTWHETGIGLWGYLGSSWRYEAQVIPGLDSELFNRQNWIQGGSASPYEFKVSNKLAGVLRIDNYSVKGLRLGISGYMGQSFKNSIKPTQSSRYDDVKGTVYIGAFDFDYKQHNIIARGYFDYGHLTNSRAISSYNKSLSKNSASPRSNVASDAYCAGVEVGYDIFSQIKSTHTKNQKLYAFGRYENYDSMFKTAEGILAYDWTKRQVIVGGINFHPIQQIVVKAEYSASLLHKAYNNENSLSIGVAYVGFFK